MSARDGGATSSIDSPPRSAGSPRSGSSTRRVTPITTAPCSPSRATPRPWRAPGAARAQRHLPAGAVVVGARPPLIAFNIELDTTDLKLAQRIAKEIRESSGGLPAVQAKGFMLTDPLRAQVSMNLLDHTTTSLATVWHEVEARANAAGVTVLRGELIGLVPLDAALQVTAGALKLDGFRRDRVIESHFLE